MLINDLALDLPLRWLQWVRNRLYMREGLRIFTVDQKNGVRVQKPHPCQ